MAARIIQAKAEVGFPSLPAESVHMILGSPPYDKVRDYHGAGIDMPALGAAACRVLVNGGVAVLVMQDQTVNGAKSLTTFCTAVAWADAGLRLFECLIWSRPGVPGAWWNRRFRVDHEYLLVFVKGQKPRHFDKEHMKVPAVHAGRQYTGYKITTKGGKAPATPGEVAALKCPGTVLSWGPTNNEPKDADRNLKRQHPATFPQALVSDMVRCFTKPGDVVLDPFAGSGTTLIECLNLGREALGFEPAAEYCELIRQRIALRREAD